VRPYCPVRQELGSQLVNAIRDASRLGIDSETLHLGSYERTALLDLLQDARQDQRNAQRAFSDHVREHRCKE
jgi:hypothetical protein